MKKLLTAFLFGLGALTATAQEEGLNDLRIVANSEYNSGESVIVQGYYAPSDADAPEVTNYAWDLMPCDPDGNPAGDPIFVQDMAGAPDGSDFTLPGSEDLQPDQFYRIGLSTVDAVGNQNFTSATFFVTNVATTCVFGVNSTVTNPNMSKSVSGNTISLPVSSFYIYTISSSGATIANSLTVAIGGNSIPPNQQFFMANNTTSFDLAFFANANAPLCSSQTFTLNFFNGWGQQVCTFQFTIFCRPAVKRTMVMLNSGLYYKGDDDKLHRYWWTGSAWNYQAINPWGGWGNVKIEGWLTGDPNVDRVFFKGKDGGLYNIFLSNGSWLLGIVGNGLFDVKSDVWMRNQQIYYIANDNLIHRRFFASNQWNQALISPVNGYQGVTAVGGMDASPSGGVWFRGSNNGILQLFISSGNYYSQFMPANVGCGGDMIWDDAQSTLYYRGTDNNIHNVNWNWITGWAFAAMTSQNGNVFVTNNLAHTPGENRVWFKGTDGRVYGIWKQSNGQWRIDWASGAANNAAGDLLSFSSNIFFTTTAKQVSNYWFSGNPSWNINILNGSAPANAIGCSTLFRLDGHEDEDAGLNSQFVATGVELFDVFPNPSSGTFRIELTNESDNVQAELIDVLGARVDAFTFSGAAYNYSPAEKMQAGVYLLRVTSGGVTTTKKIVVQ